MSSDNLSQRVRAAVERAQIVLDLAIKLGNSDPEPRLFTTWPPAGTSTANLVAKSRLVLMQILNRDSCLALMHPLTGIINTISTAARNMSPETERLASDETGDSYQRNPATEHTFVEALREFVRTLAIVLEELPMPRNYQIPGIPVEELQWGSVPENEQQLLIALLHTAGIHDTATAITTPQAELVKFLGGPDAETIAKVVLMSCPWRW